MAEAGSRATFDPRGRGWDLLAVGDWGAAGEAFRNDLDLEETPEALEGLSWAAWWLDDADTVFEARERAYQLYRRRKEQANAARMATWLAADELDFRGAVSVANGWLRLAHRLLAPIEYGPEHGWLAFHEGYLAQLTGDTEQAADRAVEAADAGRRFDVADLEMLGLALHGSILVSEAEVEEGMRYLDEATAAALAGEASIPISGAWACCFLVGSCTAILDYERAFEWCDRIAEFAERYGSRYMLAFCRAEYGQVHLWRGEWADAERMLEASVEDFTSSRPAMAGGPMVSLAELRRRQARYEEAHLLLDRAGPTTASQICRARLILDEGDVVRAVETVERLLRRGAGGRELDHVPALDLLVRAHVANGDLDAARVALNAVWEIQRLVGTEALRASAESLEGFVASAGFDNERARLLLEVAVDRFEKLGAPFEASQARIDLAACLSASSRHEDARREAKMARDRLLDLGADSEADRASRVLEDAKETADSGTISPVTPRETEVLVLLAEGLTNRQIAGRLVISEHTVHRHVTNILRKLNLSSRTAAATYAVRTGLLDSDRI